MNLSEFNFSEEEETRAVREQFEEAYFIFQQKAIVDGDPVMCQLHDVFGTYDTLHHNCLGCNFADSVWLIYNFLQTYEFQKTIQSAYATFIILGYLLVERIDTLFNIIELHKEYRAEHFKVLPEIRGWANFLKHPKAFFLTHHPVFSFHSSPRNKELRENASVVIDYACVDKYYASDDRNEDLNRELKNKENVLVIFPDAVKLARDLCQAMHDCIAVVRDNQVYRSILADKTTFYDYWIDAQTTDKLPLS